MSTDISPIQPVSQIKNKYRAAIILLFLIFVVPYATKPLPDDIYTNAASVINFICKEDFKDGEETAKKMIRKYPESPSGYFFMAAVIDSWMSYYVDNKKEDEFYRYCDLAVEKSEKILSRDKEDEWAQFFIGGAEGYKGTYEARYERWITAFRYGWKGVSVLMKLEDNKSDLVDINFGIGSYEYWRSALVKMLWWMPGVKDRREDGIKKLFITKEKGIFTKTFSSSSLIDILNNENRPKEVLPIADTMLKVYPSSSMFLWGKGQALFALGDFEGSKQIFSKLLNKYQSDEVNNHYRAAQCHLWLAKSDSAEGKYREAIAHVSAMETFNYSEDIKSQLEKYFSEGADIKKKAFSELNKKK